MKPRVLIKRGQKLLPQEKKVQKIFFFGAGSILLAGATAGLLFQNLPPEVPIFYSRPWGEEQLGHPVLLLLPLGLAALFWVINLAFARITSENILLKHALVIGALTVSILASITVLRIVILVL